MEWFQDLYDDFRQRTGFGSLPPERTRRDVDFIVRECRLRTGHTVLDLCAGTGRHTIELTKRGIHAVGLELNSDYAALAMERAEEEAVRITMTVGDVRSAPFGTAFHAAILMWNSFGYFSDEENGALLVTVRAALKPGGRFLIELLNRDFLLSNFEARSEREIEGVRVVEEREFDPLTRRMRSAITRTEGSRVVTKHTDWRLYTLDEMSWLGREAGFELRAAYDDMEGNPAHSGTRLMRLVFEAPGSQLRRG